MYLLKKDETAARVPNIGGLVGRAFESLQAWWLRGRMRQQAARQMRLIEVLSLGGKNELMLVSCADERFLLGLGAGGVETIVRVGREASGGLAALAGSAAPGTLSASGALGTLETFGKDQVELSHGRAAASERAAQGRTFLAEPGRAAGLTDGGRARTGDGVPLTGSGKAGFNPGRPETSRGRTV